VHPAGVPLIVTEKDPDAEVAELNVPEMTVLPVIENEFELMA
jgi:hypothetical protein